MGSAAGDASDKEAWTLGMRAGGDRRRYRVLNIEEKFEFKLIKVKENGDI